MSALTAAKASSIRNVKRDLRPLAANVKAIAGGLCACKSTGYFGPATGAATEIVVGRFLETVDNTGGSNGTQSANVEHFRDRWLFLVANDTTSPVVVADRERSVYALDDQTATHDNTKGPFGRCYDVTTEGVWVEIT